MREGADFVPEGPYIALQHLDRERQPMVGEVAEHEAPEKKIRESIREAPVHLVGTGDTEALGPTAAGGETNGQEKANSEEKRRSRMSSTSSVGFGKGRKRVSKSKAKASKRVGEGVSGGIGVAEGGNPAKIDSEWENEIAKNILSLYQTKLKAELDAKKGTREDELVVSVSVCGSIFARGEVDRRSMLIFQQRVGALER